MTETYTQDELARAWKDLDTTLTEYNMDRLERICLQARKNRLWEAQEDKIPAWEEALLREQALGGENNV